MNKPHVVVVGAGVGGLAATYALLASRARVTLLEQHATPGGKIHQDTVAGRTLDAGPTVFTMRWVFDSLFARHGKTFTDHVSLSQAELLARHSWHGSNTLDLFQDTEQSVEAIAAFASQRDADAYRQFASKTQEVFNTLDQRFMQAQKPSMAGLSFGLGESMGLQQRLAHGVAMLQTEPFSSLWGYLSRTFDDPRLRQLFARYATYCGSSPFKAPATLMLIAHVEKAGVWLVDGGMQALADTLLEQIDLAGGECRFNSRVKRMEPNPGGVALILDDDSTLQADAIIFNGDTRALGEGHLGPAMKQSVPARNATSLSAITRSEVTATKGFPLAHHTVFFGNDYVDEFDQLFTHQRICEKPTVYVCAQDRHGGEHAGNSLARGTPERLFSLINAPARNLSESEVTEAMDRMDAVLAEQGLERHASLGTPAITSPTEFASMFPATDGALYGRPTHGWQGSFLRPGSRSRIRHVYLCGGSVHPGAGVPMAALSGQLAADCVIEDVLA